MRAFHKPTDIDSCVCGIPYKNHEYGRKRKDTRIESERCSFIGIDGEGQTDYNTGIHKYVLLAASNEDGTRRWSIEDQDGLSTRRCLDFICNLSQAHVRLFAYAFCGYDLTKILQDLDNYTLYILFRPELRRKRGKNNKKLTRAVFWPVENPEYKLNLLNTRFTVAKKESVNSKGRVIWGKNHTINDIWKFFQGKYVDALEKWDVGSQEMRDRMTHMKNKRADFDKEDMRSVRNYCFEECRYMAALARKLTEAHVTANIPLKNYYGAGSSAASMLNIMGVKDVIKNARESNPDPPEMQHAIMSAFFGGRFENSIIGPVKGPIYSWDISSAYPYQLYFLPCLLHGKWSRTNRRKDIDDTATALIRYKLNYTKEKAWAPFPFRLENGTIVFPYESGGGWIWKDEYLAGEKLFPNVEFVEAYVYHCECDCKPFKQIPEYYRERVRIGKEGPGIVLKLGCNSCYGKLAQFIGGELGQFTSWIWAGLITSGCRAQMLDIMYLHKDLSNLFMIATDGLNTLEDIKMPVPRDTGTFDVYEEKDGVKTYKPLGGWELTTLKAGVFYARPGIYFPLNPDEKQKKKVRGRGVGRSTVFDNWMRITNAFRNGKPSIHIKDLSRFIGAKTAISRSGLNGNTTYKRSEDYGNWINRPVDMSFNPMPKRMGIYDGNKLALRNCSNLESVPYKKEILSPEAQEMRLQFQQELEQPDGGDLTDYDE